MSSGGGARLGDLGAGVAPAAPAGAASGGVVGIGTDLVEVERFRAVLARRPTLAERVFTAAELARAGRRVDPAPSLAARFAAKEAVMKALGVGIGAVGWHDIEVAAASSGAPVVHLSGRAASLAAASGAAAWHLSLTHTSVTAMATVLAERAAGSSRWSRGGNGDDGVDRPAGAPEAP